jgi:hypothetical protein
MFQLRPRARMLARVHTKIRPLRKKWTALICEDSAPDLCGKIQRSIRPGAGNMSSSPRGLF